MNAAHAGSLLAQLQQIPDPRGAQGRRHSLEAMLATVVCAVLCGARGKPLPSGFTLKRRAFGINWATFARRPKKARFVTY